MKNKREQLTHSTGRLVAVALAFALLFSIACARASASTLSETFCRFGAAAGQCASPDGVAVDQSGGPGGMEGTVYLVDSGNKRIDAFNTAGHFLMAFGTGVVNGAPEIQTCTSVCGRGPELVGLQPSGVAVDQSSHDVYVAEKGEGRIEKLTFDALTEKFEPVLSFGGRGSGPGQLDGALPLAVDSSGDVWVGDINRLQRFTSSGEYLSEVSLPGTGEFTGLAADPAGDLYTLTPSSGESDEADRLTALGETSYALTFGGYTTGPLSASADPEEIRKALEGLPSVGRGNVTVAYEYSNNPSCASQNNSSTACIIRFTGKLADTNVEPMAVTGAAVVTTILEGDPGTPGVLSKLTPKGELIERIDAGGHPSGIGVDPVNGDLVVSDHPGYIITNLHQTTILRFSPTGEELEAFGTGEVIGAPTGNAVAFSDVAQRVYTASCEPEESDSVAQSLKLPPPGPSVEEGSTVVTVARKTTATLSAFINPEGKATTYRFQYIAEAQYSKNVEEGHEGFVGATETPVSGSIGENFLFHEAAVGVTALRPGVSYRFRVVASNANGTVDGEAANFETLPPASVDASVADVTASAATLMAQIDPLGEATAYRFQYIAREAMQHNEETGQPPFTGAGQVPASEVAIGSGEEPVPVFQHVQGLAPHTEYRYRVVAVNAAAPEGYGSAVLGFTTQAPAGTAILPDGRQWELVSPPDKHGALLLPIAAEDVIQASAGGDGIAYLANIPTEAEPQGFSSAVQAVAARGPDGWSSHDISAPHAQATGFVIGAGYEYRAFSSDLSLGVLQPRGPFEQAISPEATEQTPYLHRSFASSESVAFCTGSCYLPLLTAEDVTSGAQFGCHEKDSAECGARFVDATPDLSHIVLQSDVGLTAVPGDKGGLYEYSAGQLALVSVLPGGSPVELASASAIGFKDDVARGAISADGTRVFWSNENAVQKHLYLRDLANSETLELDAVQGGSGSGPSAPVFQFASKDGSRVFFTDTQPLTADSGASGSEADLYECEIEEAAGHLSCALADLTPVAAGESGDVLGMMPGAAEDGSYAYFVANGALTGAQQNGWRETAQARKPNLYVRHEGVTRFIATLSGDDASDWGANNYFLTKMPSRVSPNGGWLAFMSDRPLTGYDNRDAESGRPDEEVFLYQAAGDGGEGKLVCVSCNPTGARPHGVEYGKLHLAGGFDVWEGSQSLAANIPGWTGFSLGTAIYQSRYLSNSGRLFFNSADALVAQDTNGTVDVYEYEPQAGEGGPPSNRCSESDPAYARPAEGCVSLITSGSSPEESAFLDASETGGDVFFLTSSRLSPLDTDGAPDVYDAHICTGESPCPPPPPPPPPACQGDACQSPAVAPEALTPSSLSFSGAGNVVPAPVGGIAPKSKRLTGAQRLARALRACHRKRPERKRVVCEKRARRAYGSSVKANKSRKGAGR